ncbi:beta-ketoacyl-ACP synthase 3 [Streptomyces sp. NPDC003077]|uniref:beta-ketoacyl-ACP synthase 3 n=1 Tax=Streptomyces sp. NPDC003077 TaxID=3154443 RepID=UPI0033BBD145
MTVPRTTRRRAGSRIVGVGAYRPTRVVDNHEIGARIGVSPQWIERRSGIVTRRFAGPQETVVSMAVDAGRKALAQAGMNPADVDTVLLATTSFTGQLPTAAPRVAKGLGAAPAAAFAVHAACAGFCYALAQADCLIRSGEAETVLVIGSEKMTDIVDPHDNSTAFLFADGAGAVVVTAGDTPGIGPVAWGSDGARHRTIGMGPRSATVAGDPGTGPPVLRIDGLELYRWAVTTLPEVAREAVRTAGLRTEDLAAFIPHQANARIIDTLTASLALPPYTVVARNITEAGNTSAASIPLAVDDLLARGLAARGDLALLVGYGAGLAYAAQVISLP